MTMLVVLFSTLALAFIGVSFAFDPTPLQDFCVSDVKSPGCKSPESVTPDDFFYSGMNLPGNTSNPYRAGLKAARIPGLNTLGLTLARLDFLPGGFIPPHYHPRAAEILTVLEGSMEVGFVTSYPNYKHYAKVLQKGGVFVVPVGLVHYQRGVGAANTVVLSAVNSQNAGIVEVAGGIFGAKPAINSDYLSSAFRLDKKTVEMLQSKPWS
ncbi:putative germin-like protein 2-1 [Salvia miltiorrhiza]|uniref:putative germin-like protein 2-1 n=1 Tax=Salvia miltiorrhiza TaxID=226208 RepID=UPI0025AD0FD6|nr:putative germin-like protein 2-1 [Salvia miltiorrhiza]